MVSVGTVVDMVVRSGAVKGEGLKDAATDGIDWCLDELMVAMERALLAHRCVNRVMWHECVHI